MVVALKPQVGDFRRMSEFRGVVHNEETGQYLHMSGTSLTDNRDHAWFGNKTQLRTLMQKQRRAKERWDHAMLDLSGFRLTKGI